MARRAGTPREPPAWGPAPALVAVESGQVHLWQADLDAPSPEEFARLDATLTPDERVQVSKFVFATDRRRYGVARAALRAILGRYLHQDPAKVALARTPEGKPLLADAAAAGLRFSVSHSAGTALYAVTAGRDVGVDIEHRRPLQVNEMLGAGMLSAREAQALRALPAAGHERAFFTVWTRKEAYAKARGVGLPLSFPAFTVSSDPERPALLEAEDDDPARWTLADVDVGDDCAAAVAVEGTLGGLRCWRWPPGPPLSAR